MQTQLDEQNLPQENQSEDQSSLRKARGPRMRLRNDLDYNLLPPEAFLKISDILVVVNVSRQTFEDMLKGREFPAPNKLGRDRVWPWRVVRDWLREVGEREEV